MSRHHVHALLVEILNISRSGSTLYRRLEQEGIDRMCVYLEISDTELHGMLATIKLSHPNDGERLILGHLHHLGVTVPRA